MKRCLLALVLVAALSGSALAQSSTPFTYPGLEGMLYSGMTPQQQSTYNAIQVYMNLSTQIVTAAAYSAAEKKLKNGDVLTAFDQTILARGPFAVTTGNQAFVPIGGSSSTAVAAP